MQMSECSLSLSDVIQDFSPDLRKDWDNATNNDERYAVLVEYNRRLVEDRNKIAQEISNTYGSSALAAAEAKIQEEEKNSANNKWNFIQQGLMREEKKDFDEDTVEEIDSDIDKEAVWKDYLSTVEDKLAIVRDEIPELLIESIDNVLNIAEQYKTKNDFVNKAGRTVVNDFYDALKEINNAYRKYKVKDLSKLTESSSTDYDNRMFVEIVRAVTDIVWSDKNKEDYDTLVSSLLKIGNSSDSGYSKVEQALEALVPFIGKYSANGKFVLNGKSIYLEGKISADDLYKILKGTPKSTRGLPISRATDVLEERATTPRSIFAILPAITAFLRIPKFLRRIRPKNVSMGLKTGEALDKVLDLSVKFDEIINNMLPPFDPRIEVTGRGFYGYKPDEEGFLAREMRNGPIHFLRDRITGMLDTNIATAMAMETINWIATQGVDTAYNNQDAIAEIVFGNSDDAWKLNPEAREKLKHAGTLRDNIVQDLVPRLQRHLNLATRDLANIDGHFEERLYTSLALLAVEAMFQAGLLEKSTQFTPGEYLVLKLTSYEYNEIANDEENPNAAEDLRNSQLPGGNVTFIRVKSVFDKQMKIDVAAPEVKEWSEQYKHLRKVFDKVFSVQRPGKLETNDKNEALRVVKKIPKSDGKISKPQEKALRKFQQQGLIFNPRAAALYKAFGGKQAYAEHILGYVDPDTRHVDLVEGQKGENMSIMAELDAMENAMQKGIAGVKHYLMYSVKRNMRFMASSIGLNYQSSKGLHRSLLYMEEWDHLIPFADLKKFDDNSLKNDFHNIPDGIKEFMVAVAFGLGVNSPTVDSNGKRINTGKGIDKSLENSHLWRHIHHTMTDPDSPYRAAIEILKARGQHEALTPEQIALIGEAARNGAKKSWSLVTLDAWADFENALDAVRDGQDVTFTNRMPMKVDGISNAAACMILQLPSEDDTHNWTMLNSVGIFSLDQVKDGIDSFAKLLFSNPKTKDSYEQVQADAEHVLNDLIRFDPANPGDDFDPGSPISKLAVLFSLRKPTNKETAEQYRAFRINAIADLKQVVLNLRDVQVKDPNDEGDPGFLDPLSRSHFKHPTMTAGVYGAGSASVRNQMAAGHPFDITPYAQLLRRIQQIMAVEKGENVATDNRLAYLRGVLTSVATLVNSDLHPPFVVPYNLNEASKFCVPTIGTMLNEIKEKYNREDDPVREYIRNWTLPLNARTVLENRVAASYGVATSGVLKRLFGRQHRIRDNLYGAMRFMAKAHEKKFALQVRKAIKANNNRPISLLQHNEIMKRLQAEGWHPSIRQVHSEPNNYETYLEFGVFHNQLMRNVYKNYGVSELEMYTKACLGLRCRNSGSNSGASVSSEIKRKWPNAERVKVAGFARAIQCIDSGTIINLLLENDVFLMQLYDGIIAGTATVRETVEKMQKAFYEANFGDGVNSTGYSIVEAIYERYDFVKSKIREEIKNGDMFATDLERLESETLASLNAHRVDNKFESFAHFENEAAQQRNSVKIKRDQLRQQIGAVNQFSKDNAAYYPNNTQVGIFRSKP